MARTVGKAGVSITGDASNLKTELAKASKSVATFKGKVNKSLDGVNKAFATLKVGVAAAAAALATLGARELALTADRFNVLQARIQQATKATNDYIKVSQDLSKIAAATGSELNSTVDVFQRLSLGAKELGRNNDDVLKLVKTVQQLGALGGSSSTSLNAGLLQFGQAMSAGIVRAEEFNSIVENLPLLANRIAEGFGVSTGQLRRLVIDGNVLSKDVFTVLLEQAADVNEEFDKMPPSLQRAENNARLAFDEFIAGADEALGLTKQLAAALNNIATALRENKGETKSFLSELNTGVASATNFLKNEFYALGDAAKVIIGSIGTVFGTVVDSMRATAAVALDLLNGLTAAFKLPAIPTGGLKKGSVAGFFAGKANQGGQGLGRYFSGGPLPSGGPSNFKVGSIDANAVLAQYQKALTPKAATKGLVSPELKEIRGKYNALLAGLDNGRKGSKVTSGGGGRSAGGRRQGGFSRFGNGQLIQTPNIGRGLTEEILAPMTSGFDSFLKQVDSVEDRLSDVTSEYFSKYKQQAQEAESIQQRNMSTLDQEAELRLTHIDLLNKQLITQQLAQADLDRFHESLKENKDEFKELEAAIRNWGRAFEDSFIDSIREGKFEFKNFVSSILQDLARITLQKKVTAPLSTAFGGALQSKGFSGLASAAFGAVKGLFGFADGGIMAGGGPIPLRRYSQGGVAKTPQLAMFGEGSKPEAYVPLPDGRSIPVTMTGGGGGGVTVNQNFTFNGYADPSTIRAVLEAERPKLARDAQEAVTEGVRRGRGPISRAVGARA